MATFVIQRRRLTTIKKPLTHSKKNFMENVVDPEPILEENWGGNNYESY